MDRGQAAGAADRHRQTAVEHLDQTAALERLPGAGGLAVDQRAALDDRTVRTLREGVADTDPHVVETVGQLQLPGRLGRGEDDRVPGLGHDALAIARGQRTVPAEAALGVELVAVVGVVAVLHRRSGRLEADRDQRVETARDLRGLEQIEHRRARGSAHAEVEVTLAHLDPDRAVGEVAGGGEHVVEDGRPRHAHVMRSLGEDRVARDDTHVVVAVGQLGRPAPCGHGEREGRELRRVAGQAVARRHADRPAVAHRAVERGAGVPDEAVRIDRGRLGEVDAQRIAQIARAVAVAVLLRGVRDPRAVVHVGAEQIAVDVVVGIGHARIADVAATVAVAVELIGVRDRRADVAGVAEAVAVRIELTGVVRRRAVVRGVVGAVAVDVVVAGVAEAVAVDVALRSDDSPLFHFSNRSKLGVDLNLKVEEERAAFLELVAGADAVIENFRRGVLERLSLGFDDLRRVNPRIVLGSVSGQGLTGPRADHTTFGSTLEAASGFSALTVDSDGVPAISGPNLNFPDQTVCLLAGAVLAAALTKSRATNTAMHVDISQRDVAVYACGPVIEQQARGAEPRSATAQRNGDGWAAIGADGTVVDVLDGQGVLDACLQAASSAIVRAPSGDLVKGFPFTFREREMVVGGKAPASRWRRSR